jgi:ketosteroid isomerase-like protein
VIVSTIVVSASSQRTPAQSDQEMLIALEKAWNEAFYTRDVDAIKELLADEFISTYDDGSRGDKAKEIAEATDFNQRIESAIPGEFTVKVFGDSAIVWFTLKVVGFKQGQRSELALSYTDVWVIRDGRWQCVSSQSTRVTARP